MMHYPRWKRMDRVRMKMMDIRHNPKKEAVMFVWSFMVFCTMIALAFIGLFRRLKWRVIRCKQ